MAECAALLGRSKPSIWALLKRRGISRRPAVNVRHRAADDTFFDVIDSEAKAYWLGFISADGSIKSKPSSVVTLTLAAKDAAHVHAFARALQSTYKISDAVYDGFGQCRTSIVSERLVTGLKRLGVHSCKSLTIQPAVVAPELVRHYWRGVVDGDGSIHRRANGYYILNLVGTAEMLNGFVGVVEQQIDLAQPRITPNGSIYITSYANKKARRVVNWLYSAASIALARKVELAQLAA